jgi:asparagine synthase (glutamine-hydrolysing)
MCGIVGFWQSGEGDSGMLSDRIRKMTDQLVHRGPDGSGVWVDAQAGVALGHRRLAILDLSEEGRQPMTSADGRYVISFNGEIYNFG